MPHLFLYRCIAPRGAVPIFTSDPHYAEQLSRKGYIVTSKALKSRITRYTKGVKR